MNPNVEKWLKEPNLTGEDLAILQFSPRAIVHGLQVVGLTLNEQLAILKTTFEKYGQMLHPKKRAYLKEQVEALGQICLHQTM